MSLLERNLAALRQNQKLLADAIAAATDISPFVERSPDGGSTVRLGGNAGPWVQSRRAPKQESERLFRDLKLKTLQPCIVVGCGMGYAIESVLAKYPESKVVVLEYNMPLLRLMFSTIDFSKSLAARRLVIAVELKGQPLRDVLEFYADEIALFDFESLFHGYTGTIKEYAEMFADLAQWVRMKSLSLRTMMHGNKQSIMNLLDNVPHYLSTPGIEEFRDVLKDVPGVLVGAGPSLERNMSVLKDFDGKVYIHAVSSALKRVAKEGIRVSSTNVVDYSHLSERYFTAVGDNPPPLWAEPRTNPRVLDAYGGPLVISDDTVYRRLFKDSVATHGFLDDTGNNVAHYGLSILRLLGCNPIIFCGLDQAFSFHITHIPGTVIHDEWAASSHRFMPLETQELSFLCGGRDQSQQHTDVYGNPIYTDNLMESSAISFENMFARDSGEVTFINATEGGRALRGAAPMPLREALDRYATKPVDLSKYLERVNAHSSHRAGTLEQGLNVLRKARAFGDRMKDIFREGKRTLNKAEKALIKRDLPYSAENMLDQLNAKLNEWRGVYEMVLDFCPADVVTRQKMESVLSDESIPELERLRILARRERSFILALERALDIWHGVLERGIERLEARAGEEAKQTV